MTRGAGVWLLVLVLLVLASAIGVVYAKAETRAEFSSLQRLRVIMHKETIEWGRLQLELASKGSLEDVMRIASGRLKMHVPNPGSVVVVE